MRLIDADALKRKFAAERGGLWAMYVVDSMPTVDAVQVVRCGECATRDKWGCPWWKDEARPDDWYCADGERKEQNDE